MGEFALTRCAGILQADGGPCPIIAIFRPDVQLGALLHVYGGDAEVDGDNHEELINKLLDIEGTIVQGAICHVFLDETPIPGLMKPEYETAQVQTRRSFAIKIQEYLESKGFNKVTVVFNGIGKAVVLDTVNSKVLSYDDYNNISFKHVY